jgi:fatty acid synthase
VFAGSIEFIVMVQKGSGKFEVVEGHTAIVSGSVHQPEDISREMAPMEPPKPVHGDDLLELTSRDIYKELRLRGYNYQGIFRSLVSADNLGGCG